CEGTDELLADNYWSQPGRSRIALGLSVGPFQSRRHEDAIEKLLDSMGYAAFRDDSSYNWAVSRNLNARIVRAFDLAVLLPECLPSARAARREDRLLGISLLAPAAQTSPGQLPLDTETARQVGACAARLSTKL